MVWTGVDLVRVTLGNVPQRLPGQLLDNLCCICGKILRGGVDIFLE